MIIQGFLVGLLSLIAALSAPAFAEDCLDCHQDPDNKPVMSRPNRHEAAVMGCETCHVTHDNAGAAVAAPNLSAKVNDLCWQCHDEGLVVVPGPTGHKPGHPVFAHPVGAAKPGLPATKDPLYPEKEFNCVSCHSPHSADMPKLFRYSYAAETTPYAGNLCAVCHWNFVSTTPRPTPPRNPYDQQ